MKTDTKFLNLTYDLCFKNFFIKEQVLNDFIHSFFDYLNLDVNLIFLDIKSQKYMIPKNKDYIGYLGDIVATLDTNTILSLEMYRNHFREKNYNKSYAYMCRLFDENIDNCKTYHAKNIISLNLMSGNYKRNNPLFINKHEFRNIHTNQSSDNGNIIMYLVRLDKLKSIPYTKSSTRFIRWLKLISADSLEEMELIGKDDEIMNDAIEFVRKWNNKSPQENFDNYIRTREKYAYEDGEESKTIEIAKKMLQQNIAKKTIIEITGLSLKDLKKIKQEIA